MRADSQSDAQTSQVGLLTNSTPVTNTDAQTAELLRSVADGSVPAFELLYDQCSDLIYTICLRVLKHEFEAKEVLSEIFMEVWQKADRFDRRRGTALSFLIILARSRAIDRLRKTASRHRVENKQTEFIDLNNVESNNPSRPVDTIIAQEERRKVQQALSGLNDVQRAMLEASYYDGLTHQQISQRFELPLGTVKTSIRRAMILMREVLHRLEHERECDREIHRT